MVSPTLIVVSGPPGSGKTTLAHAIARAVPCPAICRDEIKEGLVHAEGGDEPVWGGLVSRRTFETFFGVLRLLLSAGVTVVAEAAFQDKLWRSGLEPLLDLANIRIVHCLVDPRIARERIARRLADKDASRASHSDRELLEALDSGELSLESFEPLSLFGPSLAAGRPVRQIELCDRHAEIVVARERGLETLDRRDWRRVKRGKWRP